MTKPPQYVQLIPAAKQLGVSRQAMYKRIESGKLRSIEVYGRRLVHVDDLTIWKDEREDSRGKRNGAR